jgi:hypothetical protein
LGFTSLAAIFCQGLSPAQDHHLPLCIWWSPSEAVDNIDRAISAALHSDPTNTVVLSGDWALAFNTISQPKLFTAVAS